jgi:hypothetical protein
MKYTPLIIGFFILIVFFSFAAKEESTRQLQLDETTIITPIVENEDSNNDNIKFIHTIKVEYQDKLGRVIKLRNGDTITNRCSNNTSLKLYSESDSLELISDSRMSCKISAFFNLSTRQIEWLKTYMVQRIKIVNMTTDSEFTFENPNPLYLKEKFNKYNK